MERRDKFGVVALMEADGRFVQNVERAGEPRTDLGSEPDALGLAARERTRPAVERKVVESHIHHELETAPDLAERHLRHLQEHRIPCRGELFHEVCRVRDGKTRERGDVLPVNEDVQGLRTEALALAGGAYLLRPEVLRAQAVAGLAGAVRTVEREEARLDLGEREAVVRAGELCGERDLLVGNDGHDVVAVLERRLHRLGEPQAVVFVRKVDVRGNTVHRKLDGVLFVTRKFDAVPERMECAVDAHLGKAGIQKVVEHLVVLPLSATHRGREDDDVLFCLVLFGDPDDHVHDLLDRELLDGAAAGRTVGPPGAREKHPQVVVDLRDGRHRRARVRGVAFLVDGDGRREPFDLVHVRLVETAQKLPRVGGE